MKIKAKGIDDLKKQMNDLVDNKGFIWTAYGLNNRDKGLEQLKGYKQLFAFNKKDAMERFKKEYGDDSSIVSIFPEPFSQWEDNNE